MSAGAHWLADYTFSTGRRVHNDVRAEFRFERALITEHRDSFSFYAWARPALGPVGLALGWTPILRGQVQRQARAGLEEYRAQTTAEPPPLDSVGRVDVFRRPSPWGRTFIARQRSSGGRSASAAGRLRLAGRASVATD